MTHHYVSDSLAQEWNQLAPAWIKESRQGRNANRVGLLDAPMLKACGDVRGLRCLDCGCGEGRFSRMLANAGAAHVLGLDLCDEMIQAAKALAGPNETYGRADVQRLDFLSSATFDLAVSYLNQCDLPDSAANTREVFRILKPGGRFIIANLHPMRSAAGYWCKNDKGEKLHCILDRYVDEGPRKWRMLGCDFTNFHRTLETYITEFRAAGFLIDTIIEPGITADQLKDWPELDDELRVPNFILYNLLKPR